MLENNYPIENKGKVIALLEFIDRLEKENKKPATREHKLDNNERIGRARMLLSELTY